MCIDRLSQYRHGNATGKSHAQKYIYICVLIVGTYVVRTLLCYLCLYGIFFAKVYAKEYQIGKTDCGILDMTTG